MCQNTLRQIVLFATLILSTLAITSVREVTAAENALYKTANGVAVYLGVVRAEIVKGHPSGHPERTMHGGVPKGQHAYHVVAAIFDAATGVRISDATVMAQVSGLGLAGRKRALEPMDIAGTRTYGAFFDLPGRDIYTVKLTIERPGAAKPVVIEFKYDHRS